MGAGISLDPRDQLGATWARFSDWLADLRTPRGTFVLDAYRGWPRASLKHRCHQLCSALDRHQMIILQMSETPGSMDGLLPKDREIVERLREAYRD